MELSKINSKLYGKNVTVGTDAPISIERREKWLVKHHGFTPEEAHYIVHYVMTKAIKAAARAWWTDNIPDNMSLVSLIDRRYDIILFDFLCEGDAS